jgi:hypothetical protein
VPLFYSIAASDWITLPANLSDMSSPLVEIPKSRAPRHACNQPAADLQRSSAGV